MTARGGIDLDLDLDPDLDDEGCISAVLTEGAWQLRIRATPTEFARLRDVRAASWADRTSIRAGTVAGTPVFFSCEGDTVTLLVGHDDETWELAVELPVGLVDELVEACPEG
ncbi:MAG: hypothetical protein QM809_15705 [Gordonia sp. (in: high G+C Gram-positive bacteria)]|uniref:hypothetical protein n=1 Tax=Gordonia sp. (in: high G+C Gram-positive bacteria) TaxID=84139 RepID=UPI0039E49F5F